MKKVKTMYACGLLCLWMLSGAERVEAATTIHPDNFSFETPVCTDGEYWPADPGLTSSSPNWKATGGGAYIFNPSSSQTYPTSWCPAPTQGQQILGWISVGTTVYQLLPAKIQMGKTYTLTANGGDANMGSNPSLYHPTAVLTLCAGETDDPTNWTTLSQYSLTMTTNGSTYSLNTAYTVTPSNYSAIAGKQLAVKLTYAQPTSPQQSTNYDLTWDNVSISVSPDIKAEPECVMINGTRNIPIGWYGIPATQTYPLYHDAPLDEGQLHGFDFFMQYQLLEGWGSNPEARQAYLDTAAAQGVRIVVDLHTGSELATVQQITDWVNSVKDHPGVYGYYLEDEPDIRQLDHASLKALYDKVKELDPARPVMMTYAAQLAGNIYLDCTDIVLGEIPSWQGVVPDTGYGNVSSWAIDCKNAGKSYMVVPYPADFYDHPYPSADEFKFIVFGSIAAGVGGIMPWNFEGKETEPDVPSFAYWTTKRNEVVYPATDILKEILPVLLKGKQGLTVTDNIPNRTVTQPFTRTFKDGYARLAGDAYDAVLIGVYTNPSGNPIQLTFTLTGLDSQITKGAVVGENRTVTISNGSFTDTFSPLGVHIYRFTRYIYPANYSFESPVCADGGYWPADPGLTSSSPNWKATGGCAYVFNPTASQMSTWCPAPADGIQCCGWVAIGSTVYQQLPETIVHGATYVLKVDAGDGGMIEEKYHPTVRVSLCACNDGDPVDNWTVLSERVQTLNSHIKSLTVSTPDYLAPASIGGKRLAIKLKYDQPSPGQFSNNYDLTWDNVRIAVRPAPAGTVVSSSVADAQLDSSASNTNYGTWYYMQTNGYTSNKVRSLVKFSLPTIPAGQAVISATLGVYANNGTCNPPVANTTRVYKVLTDWQETVVTWANFNGGGQSGTNYAANALFSQTLLYDGESWDWLAGDVTSAVKDWYANPANNKGFILISDDSTSTNYLSFFTRETSYPAKVPYLSITYGPQP